MSVLIKLLGVLLSDGYVNLRRNTVSFTENEELVKRLVKDFKEINGVFLKWKLDKHHNSLRARTYSKELVNFLYHNVSTFRTRPCNQHPKCADKLTCKNCIKVKIDNNEYPRIKLKNDLLRSNKAKRIFLKYFASCDGGVSLMAFRRKDNNYLQINTELKIGSTNPIIKSIIKQCFEGLGFKKILLNNSGVVLKNLENLKLFRDRVSFLKEAITKRSKNFNGITKSELLNLVIKLKEKSKKGYWINKFKSKQELESYFKSCLKG